jgi:hypothetical protein
MNLIRTKSPQLPLQYLGDLIMELGFTLFKFIPNIETIYFSLKITYKPLAVLLKIYTLIQLLSVLRKGYEQGAPTSQEHKLPKKLYPVLCHTIFVSLKYQNTLLDLLWEIMCR